MDSAENQNQGIPSAPPPPNEVKVRTMASDLASIAASGGGLPQFQNVKIVSDGKNKGHRLLTSAIIVVIVILALALAYFGYLAFEKYSAAPASATTAQ